MLIEKAILRKNLQDAMDFLKSMIIKEITDQGHNASGNLIRNIDIQIVETGDGFIGRILMPKYSIFLDKGVAASRVPYNRGSGAGSSKYIDALIGWIKKKNLATGDREIKSFAFAIANKAKKEGHPTRGSFAFSKNNRRTEWAKFAITNNLAQFQNLLDLGHFVAASFNNFVDEYQRIVAA